MKIAYYCQHVLGIGHFHRSLEICRAFARDHEITMILGGPEISCNEPALSILQLPGLKMDETFSMLTPCETGVQLEDVKNRRREQLLSFAATQSPDCLILELYPFGRKAFRFELDPLLQTIRAGGRKCRVYCSLRDILVEKKEGRNKFEQRAVDTLNKHFDGLLIHSDQNLVSLEQTFGKMNQLKVEIHYTGFISPKPAPDARQKIRRTCGLKPEQKLIVASIGSGSVGAELLEAAADSFSLLRHQKKCFLQIFAGPYCDENTYRTLLERRNDHIGVQRFTDRFVDWLGAADLSLSMAGYNTCMNILATGVPALMYPFGQNREQRMRIEKLRDTGCLKLLEKTDLTPSTLAGLIEEMINRKRIVPTVNLDGAARTVSFIECHQ